MSQPNLFGPRCHGLGRASLTLSIALATGPPLVASSHTWQSSQTEHFVVFSDAAPETTERIALELEAIRRVLQHFLPELGPRAEPLRVLATRSARDFIELVPQYGHAAHVPVGGVFLSGSDRDEIVVRLDVETKSLSSILHHEYTHSLLRYQAPEVSPCLSEGLAVLFSTITEDSGLITLGKPPQQEPRPGRALPLDTLRAWNGENSENRAAIETQCWALAKWLLVGKDGARRAALTRYLNALSQRVDEEVAWKRHLAELDLRSAFSAPRRETVEIPLDRAPAPPVHTTRVEAVKVDALLGEFLVHRGLLDAARPRLERALEEDPAEPRALEALGRLHALENEYDRAIALLQRAIDTGRASTTAASTLVSALLVRERGKPSQQVSEIEALLLWLDSHTRVEIELPWIELAAIYAEDDASRRGDFSRTVSLCRGAVEHSPESPWNRLLLARALLRSGQATGARETAREATTLAAASSDALVNNNVCWYGAVGGLATEVEAACERAVELQPQRGLYRDSLAVVRALRGDLAGAADDLRFFLSSTDATDPDMRSQRLLWLQQLERGENPFDEATLAALSDLPF